MAGTYPDVPGYRFSYDLDGTSVTMQDSIYNITAISSNVVKTMNSNNATNLQGISAALVFIFPEPRDISGALINLSANQNLTLWWSNDTTNGVNGTWQQEAGFTGTITGSLLSFRQNIYGLSLTGVTSLSFRFTSSTVLRTCHIYGSIPTTNSPNRLRIVDLSNNDMVAQLDYGDIPQRNNSTKQFKVTNNSSTKTANNITVTVDVSNTDASPTLIGQFQLSTDGSAFSNTINIGSLAPGASTGTLYVRNTVSAAAQLGLWYARLIATPNTWS